MINPRLCRRLAIFWMQCASTQQYLPPLWWKVIRENQNCIQWSLFFKTWKELILFLFFLRIFAWVVLFLAVQRNLLKCKVENLHKLWKVRYVSYFKLCSFNFLKMDWNTMALLEDTTYFIIWLYYKSSYI